VRRRLGLACAALVLVAGCGLRGAAPGPIGAPSADALVADLAARRTALSSLRARVRLRSGLARVWTRQAMLVQRPSAIRVDVLSPFGLALALGTEGRTLWAFPPQQGVRYEGAASPANLERLLGTPLAIDDLVDVLLGAVPARSATARPTVARVGDTWVLTIRYRGGTQVVAFGVDSHELVSVEEQRDGASPVRVVFNDWQGGIARALDLVGSDGTTARIAFDDVQPNASIDPAAFAPPAATRVLPLDGLLAPG
jgi:outer membrane lipoprotein-sorting protein